MKTLTIHPTIPLLYTGEEIETLQQMRRMLQDFEDREEVGVTHFFDMDAILEKVPLHSFTASASAVVEKTDLYDQFIGEEDRMRELGMSCGTVGCSIGWSLHYGLIDRARLWSDFRPTAYLATSTPRPCHLHEEEAYGKALLWHVMSKLMFADGWSRLDNTPQGAGYRIEYLLRSGLPLELVDRLAHANRYAYFRAREVLGSDQYPALDVAYFLQTRKQRAYQNTVYDQAH